MQAQAHNTPEVLAKTLLPLVQKVAYQMSRRLPSHIHIEDLISAGLLGLADALHHYDPHREDTFKSYAEYRIRGEMLDELRRRDLLSRDARTENKKVDRTIQELNAKLGRKAQPEEIALSLGISLERYNEIRFRSSGLRLISADDLDIELPQETKDPFEETSLEETRTQLEEAITRLPRQQSLVLWLYYYEELPLREIAAILGVTPPRICQIRSEGLTKLRAYLLREERLAA